ncbi:MAG: hypothetical protein MUE73_00550, partial [Planctomycetes bacterium]|nr:hypothetical protein [Planctomycetota bacterium]
MRSCLIAFVLSGLAAIAGAEEPSAVAEEIEVLGRRLPRSIEATGASLSVVSGADLAARQTSAAGEAAASVPGAYLAGGAPG